MTTCLTIDAGIAFKLIVPHPGQQLYIDLFTQWHHQGYQLYAPTLWAYELVSTFSKMAYFGQLSVTTSQNALQLAYQLGVQLVAPDVELAEKAFAWTQHLQRAAAYDSFYLALAEKMNCELWTTDQKLARAASQSWVKLVEETP